MTTFRLAAVLAVCLCFGSWASAQETPTPGAVDHPVAINQPGTVADAWEITVLKTIDDPRKIDPKATWFTDWLKANPLPDDEQFFTARLRIANVGEKAGRPMMDLSFALLSASEFTYDGRSGCGNVPGQADLMTQLDASDSIETNLCWRVRTKHLDSLTLRVEPSMSFDETGAVWFALSDKAATPTP